MHQKPSAAERIRPFLKAMERSIDQARTARRQDDEPATAPIAPQLSPMHPAAKPPSSQVIQDDYDTKPHPSTLKARPKRLASNPFNGR